MKKIAIFASGSGTNAENIVNYFSGREDVKVVVMVCNRREAGVYERMNNLSVPTVYLPKENWLNESQGGNGGAPVVELMDRLGVDLIVLSGFLAIVPDKLLDAYKDRIVNIHPSLLPRHGGKGMWGHHVHEAVLAAGDRESGITIHRVTAEVDGGEILYQARCGVLPGDTPDSLAGRIHPLEYRYFPRVIDNILTGAPVDD